MATLTIDPEVDDYNHVLALIDMLYATAEEESEPEDDEAEAVEADSSTPIDGFTPARMRRYVSVLTTDGRKALRCMAENAPTIEMDVVQDAVGLHGQTYAGKMSTFGHAIRATKGVKRAPFTKHYRVYSINKQVAAMALEALDRIGA
jgi:hypothetical protein